MKIYVAHLDPYNGDQQMMHAPTREALVAQVAAFFREFDGLDSVGREYSDEEVMQHLSDNSESSVYIDEIEPTIGRPWQLADDEEAYGDNAGWWIIVSPDQEDELPGGPWQTEDELRAHAVQANILLLY